MRQAIALWLILIFTAVADGIADAFGMDVFLLAGAVVLAGAGALIRWGRQTDEIYTD